MEVEGTKPNLKKITVKDFKCIVEIGIDLAPITALVGANGSGKSSVLQAAQFGIAVLQQAYTKDLQNGKPYFEGSVDYNSILFRPTESFLNLRRDKPATRNLGYTICYEGDYVSGEHRIDARLEITISKGEGATVSIKRSGDDMFARELAKKSDPFAIIASGISGIPTHEGWRTKGFLDASVMHGDANLYLRSIIDHLRQRTDGTWDEFINAFRECFSGANIIVNHEMDENRYIDIEIEQDKTIFKLDMAASGMLQVIQVLAYTFFYRPPLLLLDEPDSHLHPDGQRRLCKALRTIAETSNTRIILATHSPQLAQDLSSYSEIARIVWIDDGEEVQHSETEPHYEILMGLGALSLGKKVFNLNVKKILLTEDKDQTYVAILAAACGAPENTAIHSYYGCGGVEAARVLATMISEFRPDAHIIVHRDRDFRTKEEMDFEHERFKIFKENEVVPNNVTEVFTPFNDVEHSFLQLGHLAEVFGNHLNYQDIEDIFAKGVKENRKMLKEKIRAARKVIGERIYKSKRDNIKRAREKCKLTDKAPNLRSFYPSANENIAFENCHGKELLTIMREGIHNRLKGPSELVGELIMKETEHLRIPSWVDAFK